MQHVPHARQYGEQSPRDRQVRQQVEQRQEHCVTNHQARVRPQMQTLQWNLQ